jgi:hypothetical protein
MIIYKNAYMVPQLHTIKIEFDIFRRGPARPALVALKNLFSSVGKMLF